MTKPKPRKPSVRDWNAAIEAARKEAQSERQLYMESRRRVNSMGDIGDIHGAMACANVEERIGNLLKKTAPKRPPKGRKK